MKKLILIAALTLLTLLAACGKAPEQSKQPAERVPFSKGPTSLPHISQPTLPPPQ